MTKAELLQEILVILREEPQLLKEVKKKTMQPTTWHRVSKYIDSKLTEQFQRVKLRVALKSGINTIIRSRFNLNHVNYLKEEDYFRCIEVVDQYVELAGLENITR